jgi:hypothetical protein
MNILIKTKIDDRKQAALMAVIQDLEAKPSAPTTSPGSSNNWLNATRIRKKPSKAS